MDTEQKLQEVLRIYGRKHFAFAELNYVELAKDCLSEIQSLKDRISELEQMQTMKSDHISNRGKTK